MFQVELGLDTNFSGATKCTEFHLEIKKLCSNVYVTDWTGIFSTGMGKFDVDGCTFEVQPEVYDKYSCILSAMNNEINICLTGPMYEIGGMEGTLHILEHWTVVEDSGSGFVQIYELAKRDGVVVSWASQDSSEWCTIEHTVQQIGNPVYRIEEYHKYGREEIVSTCTGAVPDSPGSGWTLLTDNCPTDSTWWRCSYAAFKYNRARLLNDILRDFIDQADCDISYSSIFFNEDPDITDPFYLLTNSGVDNYVTADTSWTNDLFMLQKSDVKRPYASSPASAGIVKLKKLLEDLRTMFNVYWDVTDDGKFILEHVIYFQNNFSTIDFRVFDAERNIDKNKFEHIKLSVPRHEIFKMMEGEPGAAGDFSDNTITYNEICSDEANEVINSADDITTNLQYIADFPDDIDESGFVFIATKFIGPDYAINAETGLVSGITRVNAHLSWANLVYNYHRYNRYLQTGEMNNNQETFFTFRPNLKQIPLTVKHCCGDDAFNPEEQFMTELGQDIFPGISAYVDSAEYNNGTEILSVIFKYPL